MKLNNIGLGQPALPLRFGSARSVPETTTHQHNRRCRYMIKENTIGVAFLGLGRMGETQ